MVPPVWPVDSCPVLPSSHVTAPLPCPHSALTATTLPLLRLVSAVWPMRPFATSLTRLLAALTAPPEAPVLKAPVLPFSQVMAPAAAAPPLFHPALRTATLPLLSLSRPSAGAPAAFVLVPVITLT